MKKTNLIFSILACAFILTACQKDQTKMSEEAPTVVLDTLEQKASYIIAYTSVQQMKDEDIGIDNTAFQMGVTEAFDGKENRIDEAEIQQVMAEFQQNVQAKLAEKQKKKAEESSLNATAYLTENAKKEGVSVTDSGLQYKIIKEGNGAKPTEDKTIRVHYEGKLIDGTVFDSSYERGSPAEFQLGQVIKGWIEGLQLMKEGAVWEFTIPPELAYGQRGTGNIGPNSVLIFKVELLDADISSE